MKFLSEVIKSIYEMAKLTEKVINMKVDDTLTIQRDDNSIIKLRRIE